MLFLNDLGVDGQFTDHGDISLVYFPADHRNIGLPSAPFHFIDRCDLLYFLDNVVVMVRDQLSPIVPICLIPIVFLRVVGSGTDHTSLAMEVTDGKAQFGRWAEGLE